MTEDNKIRILSKEDISQALPMVQAMEVMKEAFLVLSTGRILMPDRTHIDIPGHGGTVLFMPSYSRHVDKTGVKIVSVFPHNPEKGLPCIQGLVCLLEGGTGTPLALLNGTSLTALRTGAASGIATDLLARPDASRVAIIGAGIQARTQLEAICAVRPVQSVWVYDITPKTAMVFAEEMGAKLAVDITVAGTAREAIASADIICTATVSSVPVFDPTDVSPGVHINAIGSFQPDVQEIPVDTVLQARVFVDHRDSALQEAGDLIIPIQRGLMQATHILGELGEILARKVKGRTSDRDITLFKSVGVAVQDLAAAAAIFKIAKDRGLGVDVSI
jgi:alanine dehydrogenase